MGFVSTNLYVKLLEELTHRYNVSSQVTYSLMKFTSAIFRAEQENKFSQHTSWFGLCIVAASLVCIFAMAADLLHGLRNKELWFPCKYFTINAAFLSVIIIAMKLPMDITTSMPSNVDQVTKIGSMAFLCTIMSNLLPSLATMNSKELVTNITGLGIMVTTLFVNVCIQIQTGVVSYNVYDEYRHDVIFPYYFSIPKDVPNKYRNIIIAAPYLSFLLVLLIIHISSSLAILKSKKMIDVKYQELHKAGLKEAQSDRLTVDKLRQHVSKFWIVASSPQFVTVCFVTTSACGVICVLSTALHVHTLFWNIDSLKDWDYESEYQWSMLVIFIIQLIGVILGTIVPLCRSFAVLCFEVSIESIKSQTKVFKVESYWTEKLYEWKRARSIKLPFRSHKCKVIAEHLKIFFLKFCIAFQVTVVVICKIISLVPLFMICAFYCLKCLKHKGKGVVSRKMNKESRVESGNRNEDPDDLNPYLLQLQEEMKISRTTIKFILRSIIRLIKRGERRQPKDLLDLIKKSTEEVEYFDRDHVTSLLAKEDCWSLLVVTLTTIAVSLPNIEEREAKKLLGSVGEGLVYVTHVEQCLNTTDESISRQKAAGTLWHEFEVHKTWFGNNMQEFASKKSTTSEIIRLFKEKGHEEDIMKEVGLDNGRRDDNSNCKSICAKTMYRITDEILLSHAIDQFNQQKLFEHISQMISGILVDCLTNLPKVIVMRCHTSDIEKREATVQAAARLLGETTKIINTLQGHEPINA